MLFLDSRIREVIEAAWSEIPHHFSDVAADVFVVMPNHVHGILVISGSEPTVVASQHAGKLRQSPTLSMVVRSFKSAVTREIRIRSLHGDGPVWQPNYHDRVVRDEPELNRIREYIAHNPVAWQYDRDNPGRTANAEYERAWSWLETSNQ